MMIEAIKGPVGTGTLPSPARSLPNPTSNARAILLMCTQRAERREAHWHRALASPVPHYCEFPHWTIERAVRRRLQIFTSSRHRFFAAQAQVAHEQDCCAPLQGKRSAHGAWRIEFVAQLAPQFLRQRANDLHRVRAPDDRRIVDGDPWIAGKVTDIDQLRERGAQQPHRIRL
jgi:hypothetical protein